MEVTSEIFNEAAIKNAAEKDSATMEKLTRLKAALQEVTVEFCRDNDVNFPIVRTFVFVSN